MDPPIPANVLRTLDTAEGDLRLLSFKHAALAAASAQRPQPIPVETGEGDGGGGGADGAGAVGEGGGAEGGISEDDLLGLLEQHVGSILCIVRHSKNVIETPSSQSATPVTSDSKVDFEKRPVSQRMPSGPFSAPTSRHENIRSISDLSASFVSLTALVDRFRVFMWVINTVCVCGLPSFHAELAVFDVDAK